MYSQAQCMYSNSHYCWRRDGVKFWQWYRACYSCLQWCTKSKFNPRAGPADFRADPESFSMSWKSCHYMKFVISNVVNTVGGIFSDPNSPIIFSGIGNVTKMTLFSKALILTTLNMDKNLNFYYNIKYMNWISSFTLLFSCNCVWILHLSQWLIENNMLPQQL